MTAYLGRNITFTNPFQWIYGAYNYYSPKYNYGTHFVDAPTDNYTVSLGLYAQFGDGFEMGFYGAACEGYSSLPNVSNNLELALADADTFLTGESGDLDIAVPFTEVGLSALFFCDNLDQYGGEITYGGSHLPIDFSIFKEKSNHISFGYIY